MRVVSLLLVSLVFSSACIGESPEDRRRAALGPYNDGNAEHRPGQPCLVCHGETFSPGGPVFALAGTVFSSYLDDEEDGLQGAEVVMTDATGRSFTAVSNRAGNFMVEVDRGLAEPRAADRGRLFVPFTPEFPVSVVVRFAGLEEEMESSIGRDGSCSSCHRGSTQEADRIEQIWIEEGPP